jgi:malate synthase
MPVDGSHLAKVSIAAPIPPEYAEILSPEAIQFVAQLHQKFDARRRELLERRRRRQAAIDDGEMPGLG